MLADTVVAAHVGRQAALLKKPLKYSKSVVFSGGRKGFTSKKKFTDLLTHLRGSLLLYYQRVVYSDDSSRETMISRIEKCSRLPWQVLRRLRLDFARHNGLGS